MTQWPVHLDALNVERWAAVNAWWNSNTIVLNSVPPHWVLRSIIVFPCVSCWNFGVRIVRRQLSRPLQSRRGENTDSELTHHFRICPSDAKVTGVLIMLLSSCNLCTAWLKNSGLLCSQLHPNSISKSKWECFGFDYWWTNFLTGAKRRERGNDPFKSMKTIIPATPISYV